MARSRNIKPGFFKNELLSKLDLSTRLFFAGLWTVADREGRFEVRLEKLKADIFPHEQVMLESCMTQLWDKQFVTLYEADGKHYGSVNNWHKHQSPHHKEVASEIPPCKTEKTFKNQNEIYTWLKHDLSMNQSRFKESASSPLIPDSLQSDSLIPDSLIPDSGLTDSGAKAPSAKNTKKSALEILVDLGVDKQHAEDWLAVRKAKKAPLTKTALEDLQREADKAGLSLAEAVAICARKNWQGFNAGWDWRGDGRGIQKTAQQLRDERTDAAIAEFLGESSAIDGECIEVKHD